MFSVSQHSGRKRQVSRSGERRGNEEIVRGGEKRDQEKRSAATENAKEAGEEKAEVRRRAISSKDMRITFENVIHSASMYSSGTVDKGSVVACLESLYNWMVFDPDMQLSLPVAPGSALVKMWPHGATINTRRKSASCIDKTSSRKLKDIDEEAIVGIASSVVSSTFDEESVLKPKGRVMVDSSDGPELYGRQGQPAFAYGQNMYQPVYAPAAQHSMFNSMPTRIVPETYGRESNTYQSAPLSHGTSQKSRTVQRYSVAGGAVPPITVQETPETVHAEMYTKKSSRRPKVATVRRGEEEEGEPVAFADC